MKRMKLFEDFNELLEEGDYVVVIIGKNPYYADGVKSLVDLRFTDGELCKLVNIDFGFESFPYYIVSLSGDRASCSCEDQVRKAKPHEIDAVKYNL